jgi:hypothetical protein
MNITIDNRPNYVSRFYSGEVDGKRFQVHVVDDRALFDPNSQWNPGSITIQWTGTPGDTNAVKRWLHDNAYLAAPEGLVLMVKASEWNREDL